MNPALLRAAAIVIAILGIADPAITTERKSRPEVAVVCGRHGECDQIHDKLADEVAHALGSAFTVVRGPFPNAAAAVFVGSDVPQSLLESRMPAVAVVPARGTGIRIERVSAPRTTSRDARTIVTAVVHVTGADGRTIDITLRDGSLVLDRVRHTVSSDDERTSVPLTFAPVATGPAVLGVSARFHHDAEAASADLMMDVRDTQFAVLFFDHRPSWQSTFVRRAVAEDPRFFVTSRVLTSRGISTDAGRPPATLADAAALAAFDAIVIGAPELLADADVRALDRFMRSRGGTVLLLPDHAARGPWERLAAIAGWGNVRRGRFMIRSAADTAALLASDSAALLAADSAALLAADSAALLAAEVVWPVRLPAGAAPVATGPDAEPVVWRSAIGAGRLVVSGALDAWRFRDRPGFAPFWRGLLAAAAPPALEVSVPDAPLLPGASADVLVTVRDAVLPNKTPGTGVTTSISVTFETAAGRTSVRVWPDGPAGRFRGAIHAPREPGVYRLTVNAAGANTTAFVPVVEDVQRARPDDARRLAMVVASRGGRVFDAAQLEEVPGEIERLAEPQTRTVVWHPMRSAWWIVPFVLLLGLDWWVRRNLTAYGAASTVSGGSRSGD